VTKRRLSAGLWLAGLLAAGCWAIVHTSVRSDMASFMPRAVTPVERLLMSELERGPVARLILITIGGAPRDILAQRSKQMAARLRASGLFVRVANGEQLFDDSERERLFSYRYLLSPEVGADRFSVVGLRQALRQRLRELAAPVPSFDRAWIAADPTAEMRAMLSAWRGQAQPRVYRGVWFDSKARHALLLAQTRAPGFDLDDQERVQKVIRDALTRSDAHDLELDLSGPGVFAVASRDRVRADTKRLGIVAALVAISILLVSYRSLRLLLLGSLPLLSAVVAGIVAVDALFGAIHGIVLAFGITVIGVAIDYPVHLFSHLNAAVTVRRCLADIWPTIRLGAITTAMGYLAMTGTGFSGLTQFAVFAVAGLLTAAACTRWGIAGLLPDIYAPKRASRMAEWYAHRAPPGKAWVVLLAAAGAVALGTLAGGDGPLWQDDMAASSPIPETEMARNRHLHAELGVPDTNHVLALRAQDSEAALQASEALAEELRGLVADGIIGSFDLAARYLPSARTQMARRASLPDAATLGAALAEAQRGMPFKPDAFAPFERAVAAARTLAPLTPADLDDTALGLRVRSSLLPVEDAWVALVTLAGVADADALGRWLARRRGAELVYLDIKRDTRGLMAAFREHALARALWGFAAMALILWLVLRSPLRVIAVLVPGLLAVIIDAAVLRAAGQSLSLFHLVSMLLVVGISIDYSLFFSRADADAGMRGRTFHGVMVCALSTVSVFAVLATSRLPVLGAIGTTVAIGVAVAFLAALILAAAAARRGPSGDAPDFP